MYMCGDDVPLSPFSMPALVLGNWRASYAGRGLVPCFLQSSFISA